MLVATPLKSFTIACRLSISNFGATNRAPCAFFFTKTGTLIFNVSADRCNFAYSDSLTRKLICLRSLRFASSRELLAILSCSLMQSHLSNIPLPVILSYVQNGIYFLPFYHILKVWQASYLLATNTACWGAPQSPLSFPLTRKCASQHASHKSYTE